MMSLITTPTTQRNPEISIKNPKKRVTMIKHVVGKVRTISDPIPNITFGIPNKIDEEGAGNVIQSWAPNSSQQSTTTSTSMLTSKSAFRHFPATNRKALQNGCLDARSQREFALKNPVMKSLTKTSSHNHNHHHHHQQQQQQTQLQHPHVSEKTFQTSITNIVNPELVSQSEDHVFGIRSIANDVPIEELLKSPYANFEESDYPDRSNMQKKGRLPPAKSTIASRLLEASIQRNFHGATTDEDKAKAHMNSFKMKRFLKVESTVKKILQQ